MSLANIVTILRLALIPVVLICLAQGCWVWGLSIFLLAVISDGLDGALARKRNEITLLGQILDPLADKALALSALGFFAYTGALEVVTFIALLIPYFLLVLGGIILYRQQGTIIESNSWGKISSLVLFTGLTLAFLNLPGADLIIYSGIALAYLAAFIYFKLGMSRGQHTT